MQNPLVSSVSAAIRRSIRKFANAIQGAAAPEFGFISPILIISVLGIVDFGAGIYRSMQVKNAAQAGAHYAMINGYDAHAITQAVVHATGYEKVAASPGPTQFCGCPKKSGVESAACGSTCTGGLEAGRYVEVSAQGAYTPIFPYPLLPDKMLLTAKSTVRIQ